MRTSPPSEDAPQPRKFQSCCSKEDAEDARAVAAKLAIAFYVLDLEREFDASVIQPFIQSYLCGQTPNPCVLCNNHLKLGVLLDKAALWQCDYVATGHYARVVENRDSGRMELHRASDRSKDQTYYLFGLRQDQLQRFVCPLGDVTKDQVRLLARRLGLAVHDKPDSQEICFVPQNDYRAFLRAHTPPGSIQPGEIVNQAGQVLGHHEGIAFYTIGQRRGLGIAHSAPLYVTDLLPEKNQVVVGPHVQTLCQGLVCHQTNWIAIEKPRSAMKLQAQVRYRHTPAAAELHPVDEQRYELCFTPPQRAITPGQAVVFYDGDRVLGGGWITQAKQSR